MNKIMKDYLLYTFLIMGFCWGICVVCSLNGMSLYELNIFYIPYILGGLSPTIASYAVFKKNNKAAGFSQITCILSSV